MIVENATTQKVSPWKNFFKLHIHLKLQQETRKWMENKFDG